MVTILCSARAVSSQVSHEYDHQVSLNVEAYILEYRKTLELTLSPQIKISASNLLVLGVLAMFLPRIFIVFTIVFIHIFFPSRIDEFRKLCSRCRGTSFTSCKCCCWVYWPCSWYVKIGELTAGASKKYLLCTGSHGMDNCDIFSWHKPRSNLNMESQGKSLTPSFS